jgi:hypothetical protein
LKGLESENAKLKKLLADAMLDNAATEGSSSKRRNTTSSSTAWMEAATSM